MIADFLDPQTIVPLRAGYDLVLSFDTLEHVRDPFLFCEHLIAVAKPGAYLFVATVFDWPYHPAPEDYFRFSPAGLRELFENPRNALTGSFSVLYADWDEDKKGVFLVGRRLPENAARLPGKTPDLAKLCATLEKGLPRSTQDILAEFDLLSGHPWAHHATGGPLPRERPPSTAGHHPGSGRPGRPAAAHLARVRERARLGRA